MAGALASEDKGDAVAAAKTPVHDGLFRNTPGRSSAPPARRWGLPEGQMGNSEVGHLNMGAGRVVYQDFTRVSKSIRDGDFFKNQALLAAVIHAKKNSGRACTSWGSSRTAAFTATTRTSMRS